MKRRIQIRIEELYHSKSLFLLTVVFLLMAIIGHGQNVSVSNDGSSPDPSAMLDVKSTTQGMLMPRMTQAQRLAIGTPADGLMVYQTNGSIGLYMYDNTSTQWKHILDSAQVVTLVQSISEDSTRITDADGDTKIQVEETADEDIIRFDMAGTEFFRMDSGRIDVLNTGASVYIGQNAGLNDDLSATRGNTAIGVNALVSNSTGASNVAIGYNANKDNTMNSNTIVGAWSFNGNTTGQRNVGLGASTGFGNLVGSNNTFIGWQAGASNTGTGNVFLGYAAGQSTLGDSLLIIENSNSSTPLIYGDFANDSVKIYGTLSIGDSFSFPTDRGDLGQILKTDGAGNTSWANPAAVDQLEDLDSDTRVEVEQNLDEDMIRFTLAGDEYYRMELGRLILSNTGKSILIGDGAGASDDFGGRSNIAIGENALNDVVDGTNNIAIGEAALEKATGDENVGVGGSALEILTTGSGNTAFGLGAGKTVTTGSDNVFLGPNTGNGNPSDKLFIDNSNTAQPLIWGDFAGDSLIVYDRLNINNQFSFPTSNGIAGQTLINDAGQTRLIWGFPSNLRDADQDTRIQVEETSDEDIIRFDLGGTEFFRFEPGKIVTRVNVASVFIGSGAGDAEDLAARNNIGIGLNALNDVIDGTSNVAIGKSALEKATNDDNTGIGKDALKAVSTGSDNSAIGSGAGSTVTTGTGNVFLGANSGFGNPSNQLFIDNVSTADPLIFGDFTGDSVIINGKLNINQEFTLPDADGTANQIMVTNGSGQITWKYTNELDDSDQDTRIQLEESFDEDIIRFDLGGTEYFRFDNGRLEIVNRSNSVFIGDGAGILETSGPNRSNIGIGTDALSDNVSGGSNIAIGENALEKSTDDNNVAVGDDALKNLVTGQENVALGASAGINTLGSGNVFLGYRAGAQSNSSNELYIDNSNTNNPLLYGDFDRDSIVINGKLNINEAFTFPDTDGSLGQALVTDGSGQLSWGAPATATLIRDADNDTKIQTEENNDEDIIRFDLGGTEYFRLEDGRIDVFNTNGGTYLGANAGSNISTGGSNTFMGFEAGENTSNTSNSTYLGYQAGKVANGAGNTAIGSLSGDAISNGTDNTFLGMQSGSATNTGDDNVFLGKNAGRINSSGNENTFIGTGAGDINNGDGNVFIGFNAGAAATTESDKLYIDNSNDATPLIWGDFNIDSVVINGQLNINGAFTFPTADGTGGQFLQTNGAGALSWVSGAAGSGTTDYLARWTSSSTLGDATIRDDGSTVGINTAPTASSMLTTSTNSGSITTAIRGQHTLNSATTTFGVFGSSASTDKNNAAGVYGTAANGAFAVYGQSSSSDAGVVVINAYNSAGGSNENYGVKGQTSSSDPGSAGIYGFAFHGGNALLAESNARVIEANAYGTRTAGYNAFELNNTATSTTGSINKVGLNIQSTGAWSGASSENIGLNVDVSGGTTNYAALFNGGNVGIGSAAPADLLHIKGATAADDDYQLVLESTVNGSGAGISFQSNNGASLLEMARINSYSDSDWNGFALQQNADLRFYTTVLGSSSEKMRINAAGAVGIGTDPSAKLHLHDAAGLEFRISTNNQASPMITKFDGPNADFEMRYTNGTTDNRFEMFNDGDTIFRHYGSDGHFEFNKGNVGIGTTAPSSELDVAGDIEMDEAGFFYLGDPNTNDSWRFGRSGNNFVIQRREGGTWVTKTAVVP